MTIKSKTVHKLRHLEGVRNKRGHATRILTKEEAVANQATKKSASVSYIHNPRSRMMAFTSGHGFVDLPSDFGVSTDYGKPVQELIDMFPGTKVLESVKELADHLDQYYPEFGHVKDTEQPNWQPEHFPAGTVVELSNYFYSEETGDVVHSKRDSSYVPLTVTVKEVTKNDINSYCIITEENRNKFPSGFDVYNFSHVGRIVSRGTGQVVWQKSTRELYFEKDKIGSAASKKSHYYWTDVRFLIVHLLSSIPGAANKVLTDKFITDIAAQTFVKTIKLFDFYAVKHAPKKKLKAFVRKNWTKWLMSAAEIRMEEIRSREEMERMYYEDMEYMEKRTHVEQEEVITRGINDHGNNQEYLDGEPICGNCKSSYVNRGGDAPLGMGMHCMNCQNEDPVDYHDGDGDFPVISIGMPSDEQVQSDVAYLANKGNANGY